MQSLKAVHGRNKAPRRMETRRNLQGGAERSSSRQACRLHASRSCDELTAMLWLARIGILPQTCFLVSGSGQVDKYCSYRHAANSLTSVL